MLTIHFFLFLLFVAHASIFSEKRFQPPKDHRIRIAVLGAGLGGSSFVHYFHKLNVNKHRIPFVIDIYDKNEYIGGRTKSIKIEDDMIELGASILIKDNKYMYNLVNELGLHHQFIKKQHKHGKTAIWNPYKKQFSFVSYNSNSWLSLPYTLWHFSPKKVLDLFLLITSFIHKINKIYQHQNTSQTLHSAEAFYEEMDVLSLSQTDCLQYLYQQLYGATHNKSREQLLQKLPALTLLNELITGITRNNYNQNFYEMNALVCMTSIAAIGGDGVNGIWRIKEGNQELSKRMIESGIYSNKNDQQREINLQLGKTVVSVLKLNGNSTYRYKISYTYDSGNIGTKHYDIVIIAAPLAVVNCTFIGFDAVFYSNLQIAMDITYQTVYATLIEGELNQSYFEENAQMEIEAFNEINNILIGEYYEGNEERLFNCVSRKKVLRNGTNVYKMFSIQSLKDNKHNVLNDIFLWYNEYNVIEQHWNEAAYPIYAQKAIFPKIVLDNNSDKELNGRIYYNNAVEAGVSAMEITVISAYNIALLVHEYIANDFKVVFNVNIKQEL